MHHWFFSYIVNLVFTGAIHVYLTKLPILGDASATKIAYLTSLREVTIVDEVNQDRQMKVPTHIEPSFIAIGPFHLAIGMNNRAWFCTFTEEGPSEFKDREYLGTVSQIQVIFTHIHSFNQSFIHSCNYAFIQSLIHSCNHSFIESFIHSFIHASIHSSIQSFNH